MAGRILSCLTLRKPSCSHCEYQHGAQDWGDVSEPRDHPGSRTRRTGEDLIEWTPIQQYQLKLVFEYCMYTAQQAKWYTASCVYVEATSEMYISAGENMVSTILPVTCYCQKYELLYWFLASKPPFTCSCGAVYLFVDQTQVNLYSALSVPCRVDDQLRVPRGTQRAIGALMLTTPSGSDRHYTMDFAQFCDRYTKDPVFAEWLKPSHDDIINLATGDNWKGQGPFPMG